MYLLNPCDRYICLTPVTHLFTQPVVHIYLLNPCYACIYLTPGAHAFAKPLLVTVVSS